MNSARVSAIAPFFKGAARFLNRFKSCESGASTVDFVIVGSVAVSMAIGVVTTTKGGASVSATNTAAAIEAQSPMFDKLADGQRATRDEVAASYSSGSSSTGSGSTDYNDQTAAAISGTALPGGPSTGTDATGESSDQAGADQPASTPNSESDSESTETASNEATGSGTDTAQNGSTETASASSGGTTTSSGGGGGGGLPTDGADNEETEEEEQVADAGLTSKPGCENPYNKKGQVKKKCR